MIAFGAYLYMTRDDGFRFDEATRERQEAFVERQATHWAAASGLTGFGVADKLGVKISGDGRQASILIKLRKGSARRTNQDGLRHIACAAYNETRLPEFHIRVTARILNTDGSPAYSVAANASRCPRHRPTA